MGLAGGLGGDIASIGNAVGQLFQTQGNAAEANSYTSAAQLDEQNAQLTKASTAIQETQQARAVTQSLGTTRADVAGAGFTESGSALDILRSSASQGALATSLINIQGAINENAYAAEAGANYAKAKAANEANTAGTISAIASIGGALVNGGTQLAQAGQTVTSGYNYITGLFSSSTASVPGLSEVAATGIGEAGGVGAGLPLTGSTSIGSGLASGFGIQTTGAAADGTAIGSGLGADFGSSATASAFTTSALNSTIADGSALGGSLVSGSTALTLDTSAITTGASTAAASAGIGSAIASGLGVVGGAFAGYELGSMIGEGTGKEIAEGVGAIGGALLTAAILSVICTAFHKRGMVDTNTWAGAQRYGTQLNPDTFAGYVCWAAPIARGIGKSQTFAKCMAPIFIPPVNEMAYLMGRKNIKRSVYGILSHRVLLGLSWVVGRLIKGTKYVSAGA